MQLFKALINRLSAVLHGWPLRIPIACVLMAFAVWAGVCAHGQRSCDARDDP
jgi:hypothetical protein